MTTKWDAIKRNKHQFMISGGDNDDYIYSKVHSEAKRLSLCTVVSFTQCAHSRLRQQHDNYTAFDLNENKNENTIAEIDICICRIVANII